MMEETERGKISRCQAELDLIELDELGSLEPTNLPVYFEFTSRVRVHLDLGSTRRQHYPHSLPFVYLRMLICRLEFIRLIHFATSLRLSSFMTVDYLL